MFRVKSRHFDFVGSSIAAVVAVNVSVDLEMAIAYWNIVLHDRFKFLDLWSRYLVVSVCCCTFEFRVLSSDLINACLFMLIVDIHGVPIKMRKV